MKRILLFITLFVSTTLFAQTKFEKDFFHLTNLVRTNPKFVASLIKNESNKILSNFNKDSLDNVICILNKLQPIDSLVFDTILYENMKDNFGALSDNIKITTTFNIGTNYGVVKDTTKVKSITHDNVFLGKYGYGENITSFNKDPLVCLVYFLIDRGWWVKSDTHKPHFDNIIGKYKKTAVRVNVGADGVLHLFQDFSQ
jgi:hypothetical protein